MTGYPQATETAMAASPPPLLQNGHLRVKRCRYGLMLYSANDVYVGRSLDLYGEFAEGEVKIFRQLVRPGATVLDIGANIGAHTVALATIVGPKGRVLAIEPQRVIHQLLAANVALNGLQNVATYQVALGSAAGRVRVPPLDYTTENNFGGLSLENIGEGEEVPLLRVDDLNLATCQFAKIDVEGMELDALKGMSALIRRNRPAMYVENDRPNRSAPLIAHLLGLDYRLYFHSSRVFNPENFFANPANIYGVTTMHNMVCLPREAGQKIDLREITDPNEWLWHFEPRIRLVSNS